MMVNKSFIVAFDISENDAACAVVAERMARGVRIVNHFFGEDAIRLYELVTKQNAEYVTEARGPAPN